MTDALTTVTTNRATETNLRPTSPTRRPAPQLAVRVDRRNPNHHLWNNNGTWFVHYTIYPDHLTAARIRKSLKTRNVHVARRRRDRLFAALSGERLE